MTFDRDFWPTDLNVNRGHLLIKDYLPTKIWANHSWVIRDYLPTKFEASGAKRSWVISCTRWSRLAWPLTLAFDLLTWISIGVFYLLKTIYLPSLKLLGQSVLEVWVAQGDTDLWPTHLNINRGHLLIKDYLPTKFEASGAKRSWVISCTRWSRLAWPVTLTFDLLTWMSIGVIYSSRTIYLPSFGQSIRELSVAQG